MMLKVQGLSFSYNSHPVLQGVEFALAPGQAVGILGVNGAGKSTLLKCLNRILKPRGGVVLLDDRDVAKLRPDQIARRMSYVPQRHDRDQLSVFDSVLLGRKPYITWQARESDLAIVERVLHAMHLEKVALRRVDTLSGGEVQKVLIARALVQEPRVMLLDEPTSNLDMRNQLEVMQMIAHAAYEHGITVVAAIHDLNLAMRHLDTLILLKEQGVYAITPAAGVTPGMIREVYGVEVNISLLDGRPVIIPLNAG